MRLIFPRLTRSFARSSVVCLAAVAAATAVGAQGAWAQDAESTADSGSARVSLAGKLRLESQRIPALACRMVLGGSANSEVLAEAGERFGAILDALVEGNLALGLRGAETSRRVISQLEDVRAAWEETRIGVATLVSGGDGIMALKQILDGDADLFKATESLLAVVSGVYSNRDSFPFGATLAVNIVARQEVLLAQMEADECLASSGLEVFADRRATLQEHIGVFEASMAALQSGQPAVGLMAPPSPQSKAAVDAATARWQTYRPYLAAGGAGAAAEAAQEAALLKKELENVGVLYLLATSAQPDFYRVPVERHAAEQFTRLLAEPTLILAIREQNAAHAGLAQAEIDAMDLQWRAEDKSGAHDMIAEMMARPLSRLLVDYQTSTAGIVTELFVMDNKGLNVGQSAVTSDLWQGDEDKWLLTFGTDGGDLHVSEVEFDDSTGFYQTQVSMPITDPVSGARIGAVTFGVNIQSLI